MILKIIVIMDIGSIQIKIGEGIVIALYPQIKQQDFIAPSVNGLLQIWRLKKKMAVPFPRLYIHIIIAAIPGKIVWLAFASVFLRQKIPFND